MRVEKIQKELHQQIHGHHELAETSCNFDTSFLQHCRPKFLSLSDGVFLADQRSNFSCPKHPSSPPSSGFADVSNSGVVLCDQMVSTRMRRQQRLEVCLMTLTLHGWKIFQTHSWTGTSSWRRGEDSPNTETVRRETARDPSLTERRTSCVTCDEHSL